MVELIGVLAGRKKKILKGVVTTIPPSVDEG